MVSIQYVRLQPALLGDGRKSITRATLLFCRTNTAQEDHSGLRPNQTQWN